VERLCLLTCAPVRTELGRGASWQEPSCDNSIVLEPVENLVQCQGSALPTQEYGWISCLTTQSTEETRKGSLGNRKNDCRFGWNDCHFKLLKQIRAELHLQTVSLPTGVCTDSHLAQHLPCSDLSVPQFPTTYPHAHRHVQHGSHQIPRQ